MLALRPNCECCDRDLPPDSAEARICSFECTFCADCAEGVFGGTCPNCGGDLVKRPIRPAGKLEKYPPSAERVLRAHPGCSTGVDRAAPAVPA
jgi:hypothetical protein